MTLKKERTMGTAAICIFCTTGRTYTFRGVEIISDNETALTFTYQAMSDGIRKTGTFWKSQMAGWSKWVES